MEIGGRSHFVETTADGGMYDGGTKDTEPGAQPKRKETDADVGTDDVDNPVGGEGRDAEDDEERNDVVHLLAKLLGPFVEVSLALGDGEKGGAEGGADEIAKSGAGSGACASKGEGDGDAPDCPTEDGEVHGAWEREGLEAEGE